MQRQILFTDQIDVYLFQLPLFTKGAEELQDPLEKWLYFLNNAKGWDPAHLPASLQEMPISEAVRALGMLTKEELERERYEAREKAKRDHLGWEKARKKELEEMEKALQRAQQDAQRAQQQTEHWQQQAAIREEPGRLNETALNAKGTKRTIKNLGPRFGRRLFQLSPPRGNAVPKRSASRRGASPEGVPTQSAGTRN